jgi:hypothetical protein
LDALVDLSISKNGQNLSKEDIESIAGVNTDLSNSLLEDVNATNNLIQELR